MTVQLSFTLQIYNKFYMSKVQIRFYYMKLNLIQLYMALASVHNWSF